MARILILADDMTGANDTGAALQALGYTAGAVSDGTRPASGREQYDCISVNLDSRALEAGEAYRRVYQGAERFSAADTVVFSKRIDSTLRGNLGSECDALLDWMPGDPVCFAVPAYPEAGRVYYDNTLFVSGDILTQTSAAWDPLCPIRTASAKERFQDQTSRRVCVVPLEAVRRGGEGLAGRLRTEYDRGYRVILLEAVAWEDIRAAASAAVRSGLPFICADPGPFTAAVALEVVQPADCELPLLPSSGGSVLAVVGSVNEISRTQIQVLRGRPETETAILDVGQLLTERRKKAMIEAAERAVRLSASAGTVLLVLSSVLETPQERVDFHAAAERLGVSPYDVSCLVNDSIAECAVRCAEEASCFGGIFSCGGDISAALLRRMDGGCMRVLGEVIPLAVCAQLKNGRYIVTKGGMVGGPDGMCLCVDHLRRRCLS